MKEVSLDYFRNTIRKNKDFIEAEINSFQSSDSEFNKEIKEEMCKGFAGQLFNKKYYLIKNRVWVKA